MDNFGLSGTTSSERQAVLPLPYWAGRPTGSFPGGVPMANLRFCESPRAPGPTRPRPDRLVSPSEASRVAVG